MLQSECCLQADDLLYHILLYEKAADGKATKIIIPSEIQSLAGLAASLREVSVAEKPEESTEA